MNDIVPDTDHHSVTNSWEEHVHFPRFAPLLLLTVYFNEEESLKNDVFQKRTRVIIFQRASNFIVYEERKHNCIYIFNLIKIKRGAFYNT